MDYGNSSFKVELPAELKRRGVHNVFYSSLSRIHVPNNDRLFPGRLEAQLRTGPKVEEEWAMEGILSHHGAKGDILFEVRWKAGDITWLPSHEISHLPVLRNYLDVQGVDQIGQLLPGKGNPLDSEPQSLLNLIEINSITSRRLLLDVGASYAHLSFVCCIITYIPYTIT